MVAPYYVSEIAETSMRGALASLMQLMATFGVLFVDALNIYEAVHWVAISGICIAIPGKNLRYSGHIIFSTGCRFFEVDAYKCGVGQGTL